MKHPVLALLGLLAVAAAPVAQAVEILRWERLPLAVPLKVGQERVVFIDRNVRVACRRRRRAPARAERAARCTCAPASRSSPRGCNCRTWTRAR
jgi:hypothetical protein